MRVTGASPRLGSYGAHLLSPDEIGAIAREIRSLTSQPLALALWVSDHDPGGESMSQADFDRIWRIFEPDYQGVRVAKAAGTPKTKLKAGGLTAMTDST